MQLALKTKDAIDRALLADNGAAFRGHLAAVMPHMKDAFDSRVSPPRAYGQRIGASAAGNPCLRAVWYEFRWASRKQPVDEAHMIRLFNRGHLEEARMIALLLQAGIHVYAQDRKGKQFAISNIDGHLYGKCDSVLVAVPDLPHDQACLGEFKTFNDKRFKELVKQGVKQAKPDHYVQMQLYMHDLHLPVCLYFAINKNDDHTHLELVAYDREAVEHKLAALTEAANARTPPKRISEDSNYYACRFCDYRPVCFAGAPVTRNCRTCKHCDPVQNGSWQCNVHRIRLTYEQQVQGCAAWDPLV